MEITYKNEGERLTVYLEGELDHHTAKGAREAVDDMISVHNARHLIIDLGGVTFMDSSGVGLVLGRFKLMCELGGETEVIAPNASIRRIFDMAGVSRIVNFK